MDFAEDIALRFAQAAWEAGLWWVALAVLLLVAVVAVAGPKALVVLRRIEWKVEPRDETQPIPSDGGASGPGFTVEAGRPPETESGSGG